MSTLNHYQDSAALTAIYPGRGTHHGLTYTILGLCGEAGELSNQFKKVLRDDGGQLTPERRTEMLQELGDILWYVAQCATELNLSLEEVAEANVQKLRQRVQTQQLHGSGSNR